ncbi:MAG: hypothetical protein L0221_01575 [Chloroflexi bacterium]|nr:hypothetical protein [Chloroflexota bacterium]
MLPAVLAINIESDGRIGGPGSGVAAAGLVQTWSWLGALRPRLEDATGRAVRFAWFVRMDPQIALQAGRGDGLVAAAPAVFEAIAVAGDSVGLHTHAGRWDAARRRWVADHGDGAWVDRCLVSGFASFEGTFGRLCREHRFGDRFSSPAMYARLADLGVAVDLTAEPGLRGTKSSDPAADATGAIPDYLHVPRGPRRVGGDQLWSLPLSSADPAPGLPLARRLARRVAFIGKPRHRPLTLWRTWPSATAYWDIVDGAVRDGAQHLAWVVRSDLPLRPAYPRVAEILATLRARPLARRLAFGSGEDALDRLGLR